MHISKKIIHTIRSCQFVFEAKFSEDCKVACLLLSGGSSLKVSSLVVWYSLGYDVVSTIITGMERFY